MTLYGVPQPLDQVLRPLVRVAQVVVGVTVSAVFAFLGWWYVAPVPLALSFLAYEALFWIRADRPIQLELTQQLRVTDRKRALTHEIDPQAVYTATAQRRLRDGWADVRIVLTSEREVLFALWLRVPNDTPPLPFEVDADLFDHIVGGDHGSLRALAPGYRLARQRVDAGGDAIAWFRQHIPSAAWNRTACRVWGGVAPDLDLLGHHTGDPDGLWVLEGTELRSVDSTTPVRWADGHRSERAAVLLHAGRGLDDTFAHDYLTLAVLDLGGRYLAAPSRILLADEPLQASTSNLSHTHSAEMSAILHHLLRVVPKAQWPGPIEQALDDAMALTHHK